MKLFITGFGKFQGVENNPSQELVDELLPHALSDQKEQIQFKRVVTSANAVNRYMDNIWNTIQANNAHSKTEHHIFIHLGVDAQSTGFKLESQAFNEASFRVPDEENLQPQKEQIIKDFEPILKTTIDVETMSSSLSKQGYKVCVSNDAGRFVCNYVYYYSLAKIIHHPEIKASSLFVHVPSFTQIGREEQVQFITKLLSEAKSYVL